MKNKTQWWTAAASESLLRAHENFDNADHLDLSDEGIKIAIHRVRENVIINGAFLVLIGGLLKEIRNALYLIAGIMAVAAIYHMW